MTHEDSEHVPPGGREEASRPCGWSFGKMMNTIQSIHVRLLDEGTDVWRPVEAEFVGPDTYRITSLNPDPEDEHWEFTTGDVVRCEIQHLARGTEPRPCIVAVAYAHSGNT